MITIDRPEDPRLAAYCGMTDAALRRAIDIEGGVFVVEGARALRQLIDAGWPLRSVLLRTEKVEAMRDVVTAAERGGAPVYVAGQAVFDRVAGFPVHRGVLALADRRAEADPGELISRSRILLIVEGVNDHENLGALFRNAAALGAEAVLLDPSTCDPLYRRAVRVSVGHVLRVPFARLTPWPESLRKVTDDGYDLLALSPMADATLDELTALGRFTSAPGRLALLVGAEGPGSPTRPWRRLLMSSASPWPAVQTRSTSPPPPLSPCTGSYRSTALLAPPLPAPAPPPRVMP